MAAAVSAGAGSEQGGGLAGGGMSVREKQLFHLAYGVLGLVFWVALGVFLIVLIRPNHDRAPQWSAWKPSAGGIDGAHQIGIRVASAYTNANGSQLTAVQEHPPEVQGVPLDAIGVRQPTSAGHLSGYVGVYPANSTLIYAFCGLGANCVVDGTSERQQRALRREALELSLYAFKYIKGVEQVVSLVQTTKDSGPRAVFLRRSQLTQELRHPLRDTLPLAVPPSATAPDPREAAVIDALTLQNTFPAHYEPLPDGDAILVLDLGAAS